MANAAEQNGETSFKWSRTAAADAYQAPEAFLCLLSIAAAADHTMATLESGLLQQIIRRWWEKGVVREHDVEALNFAVCARLSQGAEAALAQACAALPPACRLPVFAQALDLMLTNGPMRPHEEAFAQDLAKALHLDNDEAARIRECLMIKNAF